jgi:hypothetical protein
MRVILDDTGQRTRREELETRYLVALMRIDAKVWRERTQYELGGTVNECA